MLQYLGRNLFPPISRLFSERKTCLDAVAGEEADIEAPFAAPPNGLVRLGHVDHGDHVTHLKQKRKQFNLLLLLFRKIESSPAGFILLVEALERNTVFGYFFNDSYSHRPWEGNTYLTDTSALGWSEIRIFILSCSTKKIKISYFLDILQSQSMFVTECTYKELFAKMQIFRQGHF